MAFEYTEIQQTDSNYSKYEVQFQVYNNKVYLVWKEYDNSYMHIWTGIMDLDGNNFVATKRTTSSFNKLDPQLQVTADKIYYVWAEAEKEIWTATMDLDGSNFSETKRETNATHIEKPQFQVVGSTIYYTWIGFGTNSRYQIWTATMGIDGSGWSSTERTTTVYHKFDVQFQVVSSTIYFVWQEEGYNIWTATMTTGGADWTATERVNGEASQYPQLEVVGDNIYFTFTNQIGNYKQIFTASMGTDGSDWTHTQRTEFSALSASYPQLQVIGDKIYYIFRRQVYPSDYHLYSAQMDIDGTNWTQTQETTTEYPRVNPQFQIVSGIFYCSWTQLLAGYYQIWTASPGAIQIITNDASNIKNVYCTGSGNILDGGITNITERGFEFGETEEASYVVRQTGANLGTGVYTMIVSPLKPETLYYYRAYATNSVGDGYGDWKSFTTTASPSYGMYEEDNTATLCFYVRKVGGKWSIKHGPYTTDQADIAITKILEAQGKGKFQIKFESDVLTGISAGVMVKCDVKART